MKKLVEKKSSERGGAGVKLMIVFLVLYLIANAGYQWIPVAYNGEAFKQEMHTAVIQAISMPNNTKSPVEVTKARLMKSAASNFIPPEAFIEVKQTNKMLQAHVVYTKHVPLLPFGIYDYEYQFDHTVTPSGFLTKD